MKEHSTNIKQSPEKQSTFDMDLHQTVLKQHELLLKQQELIALKEDKENDEIDLIALLPSFLRRKNNSDITVTSGSAESNNSPKSSSSKEEGRWISRFGHYLNKNIIYIAVFCMLGFTAGLYTFLTATPVYETSMTIQGGGIRNSFYANLIAPLSTLSTSKSHPGLAEKLGIELSQAELIEKISFQHYLYYNEEQEDSTFQIDNRPFFKINVKVTDNSVLPVLEEKLLSYLNSNPYVQQRINVKEQSIRASLTKLTYESSLMDSLRDVIINKIKAPEDKNTYYLKESGLNSGILLTQDKELEVDPIQSFNKSMEIFKEKVNTETQLIELKNILKVVDGFVAYEKAAFPTLDIIPIWSFSGLGIGLAFVLILSLYQATRQRETA